MLTRPAASTAAHSQAGAAPNRNRLRSWGTETARMRNMTAPPDTHHMAGLGVRRVARSDRVRERFARIRPRLAMTRREKLIVLAVDSPAP